MIYRPARRILLYLVLAAGTFAIAHNRDGGTKSSGGGRPVNPDTCPPSGCTGPYCPPGAVQSCRISTTGCTGTQKCNFTGSAWGTCTLTSSSTRGCTQCGTGGTQACYTNGTYGPCQPVTATAEICNSCDDNKDGIVDNISNESATCTGNQWCPGESTPTCVDGNLVCGGDPCMMSCGTQGHIECFGSAQQSSTTSSFASTTTTTASTGPVCVNPEQCNGIDDNCDGVVDNAPGGTAYSLTRFCSGSGNASTCSGVEYCKTDHTYETQCHECTGFASCTDNCGGASKGQCTASCGVTCTQPQELCNGIDDDCNGSIDESGVCRQAPTTCCQTKVCATGQCGDYPDGCGGTISCPSCPSGQTCANGVCF